jgi:dihydroxyacetone kinase DhaKLM complex PTS-EIIA-like component DhaM
VVVAVAVAIEDPRLVAVDLGSAALRFVALVAVDMGSAALR